MSTILSTFFVVWLPVKNTMLEVLFLFLSYKIQEGQNRKAGIATYKVPEKYTCIPSEHVSFKLFEPNCVNCCQTNFNQPL